MANKKKFGSVEEIFDEYLPKQFSKTFELLDHSQVNIGEEIASTLLKEFEHEIRKKITGFKDKEGT